MACTLCFLGDTLTSTTSLSQHVAKGIARGNLDPFTTMPIQREPEATEKVVQRTYQLKNFKPDGEKKRLDLPAQKNLLTNYFCFASLEAKRNFRAPRITSNHLNKSNKISSHSINTHEVKCDDLKFADSQDLGPHDDRRIGVKPLSITGNSVCKPCISLHKDLELDEENASGDKNIRISSSYYPKNDDDEYEKCRKEEKKVIVKSRYFLHVNTENADREEEKSKGENSAEIQINRSDLDSNDCKSSADDIKQRMKSSYFGQISIESENFVDRGEELVEPCNYGVVCKSLSSDDNLLEGNTVKKRKLAQTDSPIDDTKENKWSKDISGSCTLDIEEDTNDDEEEKMACDISHLGRYSDIAGKSMKKFVSVISSFKYSFSGSRASGLRAPLRDIKNNDCIKRSSLDVDLKKFTYAPAKRTAASRCLKSKI
ncbi:Exonuclease 1 [Striga hermonthica]|uniref:Exonuclease 1 n=1 Tax=Striga hermonthica TaxID=68872 RepID=A0A9N7RJS4_STRHE|nr:Exonuclease 1 [Striga hermonthica]